VEAIEKMDLYTEGRDYNNLKNQGTGSHGDIDDFKIIPYPFGKYQIKIKLTPTNKFIGIVEVKINKEIKLTPTNKFIGIVEVKINKDFLSYKQKTTLRGFHDVDEFYSE
jgi:hypothetical protein